MPTPSFADLTRESLRIGLLGFGGPAGQIALMHRVFVDERRWVEEDRFLAALNACMLLPGPEAQQLATYVGWHLHGVRGGLVAGTLFVLPGLVLILALALAYAAVGDVPAVAAVFYGLKAAVLAIVVEALLRIGRRALKDRFALVLAGAAFVGIFALAMPFPAIVLAAALLGALRGGTAATAAPPPPGPARPLVTSLRTAVVWSAVWASLPLLLVGLFGRDAVFATVAGFFSTMAVVTFGGAYAVLAYVAQAAVESYGWLSPHEMLDALALAETTPGPLILVLVFVGALAGWRDPGILPPAVAGGLAGLVTAWVTFAPSFLWIFVGAPYLDRILANPRLKAALAAVTASVVGVILNLTLWFALHVLFRTVGRYEAGPLSVPLPDLPSLDPAALVLAALSGVLVFGLKARLTTTLAFAALAGLLVEGASALL